MQNRTRTVRPNRRPTVRELLIAEACDADHYARDTSPLPSLREAFRVVVMANGRTRLVEGGVL